MALIARPAGRLLGLLLGALLAFPVAPARGGNLLAEIEARPDRDSVTVGAPILLELRARGGEGVELSWPPLDPGGLGSFLLLGEDSLRETDLDASAEDGPGQGESLLVRRLSLAAFETGELWIPPQSVRWRRGEQQGEQSGDSLRITVYSLLAEELQSGSSAPGFAAAPGVATPQQPGAAPGLPPARDIVDPMKLRHGWLRWLERGLIAGGALLAAGLAWWLWRRHLRRLSGGGEAESPRLSPWERWQKEMARIEREQLWRTGETAEYYSELSLALRGLLEDSLGLPFREMTQEEVLCVLPATPLETGQREALMELLRENDLVKYARRWPEDRRNREAPADYHRWADEARPRIEARETAEAEQGSRGEA